MRFMLETDHYVDDKLLPKEAVVGDAAPGETGSIHPWRYEHDNLRLGIKAGQARPPSRSMMPLDDEARRMYKERFGEAHTGDWDPTKPIPVQGNVQTVPGPSVLPKPVLPLKK